MRTLVTSTLVRCCVAWLRLGGRIHTREQPADSIGLTEYHADGQVGEAWACSQSRLQEQGLASPSSHVNAPAPGRPRAIVELVRGRLSPSLLNAISSPNLYLPEISRTRQTIRTLRR